jgi:hypothetical protein
MPLQLPEFFDNARMKWIKRNALLDIEHADLEYFQICAARAVQAEPKVMFYICHGPYVLSAATRFKRQTHVN